MARNLIVSRRDWARQGGTFDPAYGAWTSLTNILDPDPQLVAEAVVNDDWSATRFRIDLGAQHTCGIFWFANLRTTRLGLIQVTASLNSDMSSPTYDSGLIPSWPQDSDSGGYTPWGEWTVSGVYSGEEYGALGMPRFFVPAVPVEARYVHVQIKDGLNTEPLQIGCFGVSEVYELGRNMAFDWGLTTIDESEIATVPFGSSKVTDRGRRRRINLGFDLVDESEFWAKSFGLSLYKGRALPLVIVPFPEETAQLEKQGLYGGFSDDGKLRNPFLAVYAMALQFDQRR